MSPLLCTAAACYDLAHARLRFPAVRTALFVIHYLLVDAAEVILTGLYWVGAGFGARLGSAASIERHHRLQQWSVAAIERRAGQLLGARIVAGPGTGDVLRPGPVIVCSRHVNLLDAGIPVVLLHRFGFQMRAVIMAEMLVDPGFDLLYSRLGSVFIARERGSEAQRAVGRLADGIGAESGAVIFPEGRLFRPELAHHLCERIAARDPARAQRVSQLRHVLPPRPGGVQALLDALPDADVVFLASAGLDAVPRFADFARLAPLASPVRVTAWRCPRATVPEGVEARTEWLDDQWQRVDDWVSASLA